LNVKSEEEHEVLQKAELSARLIQRTTSEAPQRLCTTSDSTFTRSQRLNGVQTRTEGTYFGDYVCAAESGRYGPRSSVVFLNPSRSLGLRVAYESVMTFAEDRNDLV
jgi:hypothetical protein